MSNLLIVRSDWSDSATLTSSTSGTDTLPASNLQKAQPSDVWETAANTSILTLDRQTTSKPFNFVGLLYTNMTTVATWQVKASNDPGFPGDPGDYDSTAITFVASPTLISLTRRHGFVQPSTANMNFGEEGYILGGSGGLARRYVQLTLTNSVASTIQAGRLIIGQAYRPTKNAIYGASPFGIDDPARVTEMSGGQRIPHSGPLRRRSIRFTLDDIPDTEALNNLPAIMETCGGSSDVLVVFSPADAVHAERKMVYGTLAARQAVIIPAFGINEMPFEITEMP